MNEQTKHTPGPWYEAKTGNHQGLIVDEKTGENIAVAYDKKNARLIAAAPDLLEACELVEAALLNGKPSNPERQRAAMLNILRTAIAKAEGRE